MQRCLRRLRARRGVVAAVTLMVAGLFLLAIIKGRDPAGDYLEFDGSAGRIYVRFESGTVTMLASPGVPAESLGHYFKREDDWYWTQRDGETNRLRPSWIGIRVAFVQDSLVGSVFRPRRWVQHIYGAWGTLQSLRERYFADEPK